MNGYLAIILAAVFWGLVAPVQKAILGVFTPSTLSFWRFFFASAIFILFYYFSKEKFPKDIKSITHLLIVSSLFSLGVVFYINGLNLLSVTLSQGLSLSFPIFTSLGAAFLLKENINRSQILGFFLGLVGLSIVIFFSTQSGHANPLQGSALGTILILASNLSMAGYFVFSRSIGHKYTPSTITLSTLLASLLVFLILFLFEAGHGVTLIPSGIEVGHILGTLYTAVFGSIVTFLLFQHGMKTAGSFFAGLSLYIQFPVVVLSGVLFFGDIITPIFIVGTILSIFGAILGSKIIKVKLLE